LAEAVADACQEFDFPEKESIGIGRSRDNEVVSTDTSVSRHHCLIVKNGGGYFIRDRESKNGFRLNKIPYVKRAVDLTDGDTLDIGECTRFRVEIY